VFERAILFFLFFSVFPPFPGDLPPPLPPFGVAGEISEGIKAHAFCFSFSVFFPLPLPFCRIRDDAKDNSRPPTSSLLWSAQTYRTLSSVRVTPPPFLFPFALFLQTPTQTSHLLFSFFFPFFSSFFQGVGPYWDNRPTSYYSPYELPPPFFFSLPFSGSTGPDSLLRILASLSLFPSPLFFPSLPTLVQ